MDANFQNLDMVVSIVIFLAVIPVLWISGKIILRSPISESRSTRLFLWFVLGGFFLIPLVDLISYLRDLISLAIPLDQNTTEFPLFLGKTSWLVYSTIAIATSIAIYSFAIYFGKKIIAKYSLSVMKELNLNSLEKSFIVMGLAGLFNYMIRGIVVNFIWMRIPVSTSISSQGLIGSFIAWILAFIVLSVAIIIMNGHLKSEKG